MPDGMFMQPTADPSPLTKRRDDEIQHRLNAQWDSYSLGALAFVADWRCLKDGSLNFWNVGPADDRDEGWALGRRLGLQALMFDGNGNGRQRGLGWLLANVAVDQARTQHCSPEDSAIREGFWEAIGAFAAAGVTGANLRHAQASFQSEERKKRAEKAEYAEHWKQRKSDQCRQAALIGAEKRRAKKAAALSTSTVCEGEPA